MNFYFLAFSETPIFTISRLSINTAHLQTILLLASWKGKKKKIFVLFILAFRLTFSCLVNSILSNPWKCVLSCPSPWGFCSQQFVQLSRQGGLWIEWIKSELLLPTQDQLQDLYRRKSHLRSKRGGVVRGKTWTLKSVEMLLSVGKHRVLQTHHGISDKSFFKRKNRNES